MCIKKAHAGALSVKKGQPCTFNSFTVSHLGWLGQVRFWCARAATTRISHCPSRAASPARRLLGTCTSAHNAVKRYCATPALQVQSSYNCATSSTYEELSQAPTALSCAGYHTGVARPQQPWQCTEPPARRPGSWPQPAPRQTRRRPPGRSAGRHPRRWHHSCAPPRPSPAGRATIRLPSLAEKALRALLRRSTMLRSASLA